MIGAYSPSLTPTIRLSVDSSSNSFPRRRSSADPMDHFEKGGGYFGGATGFSRSSRSINNRNSTATATRRAVLLAVLSAVVTVALLLLSLTSGSLHGILQSYQRASPQRQHVIADQARRPIPTMYHYNATETRTINVLNTKTVSATIYNYRTQVVFASPTATPKSPLPFELDLTVYPDANKHLLPPSDSSIQQIPSIVHYVWLSGKPGMVFPFLQYISFASAVTTLKPEKIILWRDYEPTGWYWTRLLKFAKQKNVRVIQMPARSVDSILWVAYPIDYV